MALQEKLQPPPKIVQPPPKMIPPPPPKANGQLPEATREIEEIRQQVKNLEGRITALEGKGSKKSDTQKNFKVGQIIVVGNTTTRTSDILKLIPLSPGQVFDDQALREAEKNLAQFNPTIRAVDGDTPEFKDILVKIKEK
jgi:hypothetical protein